MLSFLPSMITGCLGIVLLALNTLVISVPLFCFALLKFLIPLPASQKVMGRLTNRMAEFWISGNTVWMKLLHNTRIDIEGIEGLDPKGYYLVTANHQSWADILFMQNIMNHRIPFMKFFLKQELIWVPLIGLCWWALDFPFMKRYTREYLQKHPEKHGKDLETTRRACNKFRSTPVSVVNYLEGTRFSRAKHEKQQSPFKYLLKPRAGGISFVLGAMGDQINTLLNITIHYHDSRIGFWDFLCGKISHVTVKIDKVVIPESFVGCNYQTDDRFRKDVQIWINDLWHAKDQQLNALKTDSE